MVVSPANPAYTEEELFHQLSDSEAKAIVTVPELLSVAVAAGKRANIPRERIILFRQAKDGHEHYSTRGGESILQIWHSLHTLLERRELQRESCLPIEMSLPILCKERLWKQNI
jgi:acyl-CoA synthetase (AMP-forming)/AMP-acid ligase II